MKTFTEVLQEMKTKIDAKQTHYDSWRLDRFEKLQADALAADHQMDKRRGRGPGKKKNV